MELYRDVYGCTACIREAKTGSARLTVYSGSGKIIHSKTYTSKRGAKIAMGKMSDGWTRR